MTNATQQSVRSVVALLNSHRFIFDDERELQDGIEKVFMRAEIQFERECRLTQRDRPDFFLRENGVAVEVKIKSSPAKVSEQLERYADLKEVNAVILVTTRMQQSIACTIPGKSLHTVYLRSF